MTPRTYEILRRAVEEGTAYGYRRAHKHTEEPGEAAICGAVEMAVMGAIDEVFSFDEQGGVASPTGTLAVRDVLLERAKQYVQWGHAHDDEHQHGELAAAAGLLVGGDDTLGAPDWAWNLIGKHRGDRRRQLVIGAALAIAEIERLDRAAAKQDGPDPHEFRGDLEAELRRNEAATAAREAAESAAMREGRAAAIATKGFPGPCPYPAGSVEANDWRSGVEDAVGF